MTENTVTWAQKPFHKSIVDRLGKCDNLLEFLGLMKLIASTEVAAEHHAVIGATEQAYDRCVTKKCFGNDEIKQEYFDMMHGLLEQQKETKARLQELTSYNHLEKLRHAVSYLNRVISRQIVGSRVFWTGEQQLKAMIEVHELTAGADYGAQESQNATETKGE